MSFIKKTVVMTADAKAFDKEASRDTRDELPKNMVIPSFFKIGSVEAKAALTLDSTIQLGTIKPVVYMFRGVAGAGKTTLAKKFASVIKAKGFTTTIVSADDFFVDAKGDFVYQKDRIVEAHDVCRTKYRAALHDRIDVIIVDNMNLEEKYCNPYIKAARAIVNDKNGLPVYSVKEVVFQCPTASHALTFLDRSKAANKITDAKALQHFATFTKSVVTGFDKQVQIPVRGVKQLRLQK